MTKIILITFVIILNQTSLIAAIIKQNKSDNVTLDLTVYHSLRKALLEDNQLSSSARNIKIMTLKDSIILIGPVASKAEKVKIENLARARAGNKKVYNRITF